METFHLFFQSGRAKDLSAPLYKARNFRPSKRASASKDGFFTKGFAIHYHKQMCLSRKHGFTDLHGGLGMTFIRGELIRISDVKSDRKLFNNKP
jgi:hypothetical protein